MDPMGGRVAAVMLIPLCVFLSALLSCHRERRQQYGILRLWDDFVSRNLDILRFEDTGRSGSCPA